MATKMVYISPADAACCAQDVSAPAATTVFAQAVRLLTWPISWSILALAAANRAARLRHSERDIPPHLYNDLGLHDGPGQSLLQDSHNVRFPGGS